MHGIDRALGGDLLFRGEQMFKLLRGRAKRPASYSFYVWENGRYIHVEGGQHDSDVDAASAAMGLTAATDDLRRPASLDAPHLHVIREDGVHILTLELNDEVSRAIAA